MAKPVASRDKTVIDPAFYIPEGLENEFVYAENTNYVSDEELDVSEFTSDEFVGDEDDFDNESTIPVPDAPVVILQTIRTAPGGTQVVDVIVEVEDIPGVEDFELHVSKP